MDRRQFLAQTVGFVTFRSVARSQSIIGLPQAGLVDVGLEARNNWIPVGGRSAYVFAFNGQVPGPKIEARAGDTIRIRFQNALGVDGLVEPAWRDVVLVPAGRTVRTRVRFSDYVGKAMYRCHILDP